MRNLYLRKTTAAEIDGQVSKVLRGLGNPKPPLRLDDVRALLKLDRQYYSKTSDGMLRETVSRLMVAGKQIRILETQSSASVVAKARAPLADQPKAAIMYDLASPTLGIEHVVRELKLTSMEGK